MANHHIVLYVAPQDEECETARRYLAAAEFAFIEKDVANDPGARGELVHKTGSTRVPTVDVDGHVVAGFFRPKWDHLIQANALSEERPRHGQPRW